MLGPSTQGTWRARDRGMPWWAQPLLGPASPRGEAALPTLLASVPRRHSSPFSPPSACATSPQAGTSPGAVPRPTRAGSQLLQCPSSALSETRGAAFALTRPPGDSGAAVPATYSGIWWTRPPGDRREDGGWTYSPEVVSSDPSMPCLGHLA